MSENDDEPEITLTDGTPVTGDHREIIDEGPRRGQQKGYVVLSAEERAKGFVEPVRQTYTHQFCGMDTTMGPSLAETYARDPAFYDGTFCTFCQKHFPCDQFTWKGEALKVGARSTEPEPLEKGKPPRPPGHHPVA